MESSLPFSAYAPGTELPRPTANNPHAQYIEEYVDDCIDAGLVHTIHVSERKAFKSCRQRWDWAYREDLHSTDSIRALEFGLAYHHAMEKFYDPATWHLDKQVLAEHAIAEFRRYTEATYARLIGRGPFFAPDHARLKEDFADRLVTGESMLRHYFDAVAPETDTFEPLKVEIAFEVALLDPDGNYLLCRCDRCWARQKYDKNCPAHKSQWLGLPVTLGGRLDWLGKDLETAELGVGDWKTTAALMTDVELDTLDLDEQISTYLLAMHKLGVPAREFWYHEQKKVSPVPPEPLTRKYKGRMYQASKDLPTTYEMYYETVAEGDPAGLAAGAYDEYLDWLKTEGPKFYQRTVVTRNDEQLRQTEHAIYLEYLDMLSGRIYISPDRRKCSWCNFFSPCLGKQRGEPYQHALNTLFIKGGRELSNDKNAPKPDPLPKRDPGKALEQEKKNTSSGSNGKKPEDE
jgi:hypothetical protein